MSDPERARAKTGPSLAAAEGAAAAVGMCVFALFVRSRVPLVFLSAFGLAATALAVARSLRGKLPWAAVFGLSRLSRRAAILTAVGCAVGAALGVPYRWYLGTTLVPGALGGFALLAALIGAAEELVYRGYVQGRFRGPGALPAVTIAALSHAAYKCALFAGPSGPPVDPTFRALPGSAEGVNFLFLAAGTFAGGMIFGALRELGRNVIPAVAAHVCFDIVVYGALAHAPWWVW